MRSSDRTPSSRVLRALSTLTALALTALALPVHVARADQQGGWELMLTGRLDARFGEPLRLSGVAYSVAGLDDLRPAAGPVEAELRHYDSDSRSWSIIERATAVADRDGRFALDVPTPTHSANNLQLRIRVGGQVGRWFEYGVRLQQAQRVDLLTDRNLYQAGETVHVLALVRNATTGAPAANAGVAFTINDPSGRALLERRVTADASGSVAIDLPLPTSANSGGYRIVAQVTLPQGEAVSGSHSFQVGRRTVERLLAELTLDQRVVRPRQRVTGRVAVHTPSGAPVVGAAVAISQARGESVQAVTDDTGIAVFELAAPSYLSGDVATTEVTARITHPGHGALHIGGSYVLARTRFQVEVHAASGGVVPGVPTFAYLRVSDPLREPAPAGTTVVVSGPAVRAGRHSATTDAHGLIEVPIELALADVAPIQTGGYNCPSGPATLLDVEISAPTEPGQRPAPMQTRTCVSVARDATVVPRVTTVVLDQGGEVEVALERREAARDAAVLVEVLSLNGSSVLVSSWVDRSSDRVSLRLPPHALGVLWVRARPVSAPSARAALDTDGVVAVGIGAYDALLVRHADAFALSLTRDREVYDVGTRAEVAIGATPAAPNQAWATLVARDLAAHGGEPDYVLPVMEDALRAAIVNREERGNLLVRATLAAALRRDSTPNEPPPLVRPPWDPRGTGFSGNTGRDVHRDPLAAREELRRRQLGRIMVTLEQLVEALPAEGPARDDVVSGEGGRQRFRPDVLAHLHQQRNGADYRTLGGETMTVAMLSEVDPSFDFDRVARRVARAKLLRLMVAITAFTNPDDETAARASAGVPPEEWLSRLVQLGAIQPAALLDPWGRPFVFRRAGTRRPPVMLSDRAPGWELVSAGPDGRAGNGDDVLNPFERVVPRGTIYAVVSGEDALMRRLALLAPGPEALSRMHTAYTTISQEARDEEAGETLTASSTEYEMDDDMDRAQGEEMYAAEMGTIGYGSGGGSGVGYGRASARMASAPLAGLAMDAPAPEPDAVAEVGGSTLASMGERIREDFPATLFFVGRVPLDGARTPVTIPVADALTTYRVEAIAWTASGFLDVARTTLRVDQSATVDTPVPNAAVVGDVVRFPVRVANRTGEPLQVLVDVTSEGVQVVAPAAVALTVPPRDAAETTLEMRLPVEGEGHLVVRAVRADTRAPLDAVRRPLAVRADARLVHVEQQVLVGPGESLQVDVPADASERGPGELRVASGVEMFGSFETPDRFERGWARRMAGLEVPSEELAYARSLLQVERPGAERAIGGDPASIARAISTLWNDSGASDMVLARGLRSVTRVTEGESADPGRVAPRCAALLGLVPAARAGGRAALQEDLRALVALLRAGVGDGAARMDERQGPTELTCAAAALALTRGAAADERAAELLRRSGAYMVEMGEGILVEDPTRDGTIARTLPTAYTALAMIGQDRPAAALRFLRAQADVADTVRGSQAQAPTVAALAMLTTGVPDRLGVSLDGRTLAVRSEDGVHVAALEGVGRPGRHTLVIDTPVLALVYLDVRYGRPWTASPERPMPVDIEVRGELGARDTRAGISLTLRNRMPRTLARGVAEVDLPAGVELDQPTRDALAGRVRSVTQLGRTLLIELRPLPAGGTLTLPLPIRYSVSGSLRGLGVSVLDQNVRGGSVRPAAVLPSRALSIPDAGPEPEAVEAGTTEPPGPPPIPPPIPLPRPVEVLAPVATLISAEVRP
ncbi:MAG: hypothetical protein H6725_19790 [Sandaracinaceae bacterium]|nr:hypothetical protein [Sandaracinaceae bacterium]